MASQDKRVILGITGNIACGKSAVLGFLDKLSVLTLDADLIAHSVITPEGGTYREVVEEFGPGILASDGRIDRSRLGQIVFSDPARLAALERITHPAVIREVERIIHSTDRDVAVDAIKLFESGLDKLCTQTWAVVCSPEQQLRRLRVRNGYSEAEALLRINSQPPQEEKARLADVVIDNSGTLEQTQRQTLSAWHKLESTHD